MKKIWTITLLVLLGIIAIIPMVLSLFKGNVYCDEGYYLSIVDSIGKGYIPYTTMSLGYPPLWFYILAGFKLIFHIPDGLYEPYLIIHYFTVFGCVCIIYRIVNTYIPNKVICYLSSIFFLLSSHWLRGNYVLLEIPSILFGLLSLYVILRKSNFKLINNIFAGFFASCACLCKQYGIGFLLLDIFMLSHNKTKKDIVPLLLGASIPIMLSFVLWGKSFGQIWISDYGAINTDANLRQELLGKIKQIGWGISYLILMIFPGILLCGFTFRYKIDKEKHTILLLSIFGITGFLLQFFFNRSLHYFLYLLPFVCILFGIFVEWAHNQNKMLKYISICLLSLSFVGGIVHTYYRVVLKIYLTGQDRSGYYAVGKEIKDALPNGSTVYFPFEYGPYEQYFFSGFLPPNIEHIGYSFGPLGLSEHERKLQASSADFIIIRKDANVYDELLLNEIKSRAETSLSDVYMLVYSKK